MNFYRRFQTTIIIVGFLFSCPLSTMATTIAFWDFEEGVANTVASGPNSVLDTSGNGRHGTPSMGPFYRSSPVIGSSLALEFDGVNDRVLVADHSIFRLTQSISIEAYIRVDTLPTANDFWHMILFRGDNRGGLDPYWLGVDPNGNIRFNINNAINQTAAVLAPITLGNLTHVVATLDDATGDMRLFIDGVLKDSQTTLIRPFGALDPSSSPGLGIGSSQQGSSYFFFDGVIDDLRLSNHVVPEPATILLLGTGLVRIAGFGRRRTR